MITGVTKLVKNIVDASFGIVVNSSCQYLILGGAAAVSFPTILIGAIAGLVAGPIVRDCWIKTRRSRLLNAPVVDLNRYRQLSYYQSKGSFSW